MKNEMDRRYAFRQKAEATASHAESLTTLYLELLRMLNSKNVISDDDVDEIFFNAIEQSSEREVNMIQLIYDQFTGEHEETDDSEDEEDDDEQEEGDSSLPKDKLSDG